jgi:hypothetical protein
MHGVVKNLADLQPRPLTRAAYELRYRGSVFSAIFETI